MKIKKLLFTAAIIITAALMLTLGASATGFIRGDFNSDGKLDSDDAIYLLYSLYFPDKYPICQPADVNGDGVINTDDVVFLLYSYLLPEEYPFPECITHTIVVVPGVESTCVEAGNTEGSYCGDCGAIISEAEIIPLISHKYSEVVEVVAPTCCNDGYSLILCSVCNNRFKADIVLSEGHSFSEPQVIKEPTCTENGIYEQTCSVCKETITSETVADGHSYEVNETGDPVCVLCSHTVTADEQLSDEKTILRDCPSDFAFTVETDKGEKYIFENLIIYNIALGKDDPDSTIPFNIINLGNGKYEILPKADYSEGTTYAAEASGDIIITEADDSSLEFKIDSKDRSFSQYNKDLIFIPLPDVESSERNGYIVAPVIEKELLYLTVPDSRTITPEYVGKLICAGSYSSTEELNSDPSRECYFGKVEEIYFSENGECTLTLSCPTLGEIYENLDFSDSYAIDFDILDLEDALAENAIEAMYESESFAEFLATVQTAGDMYAEEKQFYAASIFDSFSITPSVITSGKT
ncbi:MAG: dockerin type I repeat-containing protein, partial [Clostridia bacterium]|nr:dockerin type I repeat-containing protein [Clostridia bacterium]